MVKFPLTLSQKYFLGKKTGELKSLKKLSVKKERLRRKNNANIAKLEKEKLRNIVIEYMQKDSLLNNFTIITSKSKTYQTKVDGELISKNEPFFYTLNKGDTICFNNETNALENVNFVGNELLQNNNVQNFKPVPLLTGPDVGHYYPNLIRGLQVTGFGVYNCDQVFIVKNPIKISAHFINKKGDKISAKYLSMIDLSLNAAFSFSPERFTLSSTANNVFFLLDDKDNVFIVSDDEIKSHKLKNNGNFTFVAKNRTEDIKTVKDLKKYLVY